MHLERLQGLGCWHIPSAHQAQRAKRHDPCRPPNCWRNDDRTTAAAPESQRRIKFDSAERFLCRLPYGALDRNLNIKWIG